MIDKLKSKITLSKLVIIPVLIFIVLFSIGLIFLGNVYNFQTNLKEFILRKFETSTVRISLGEKGDLVQSSNNTSSKVYFKFQIIEQDKENFKKFLESLGAIEDVQNGFSMGLDEESRRELAKMLPIELSMVVGANRIDFKNQYFKPLQTEYFQESYEFATGSGRLNLKKDKNDLDFLITNPAELTNLATQSGMLHISSKATSLFSKLGNIATIKLMVHGKNINGSINLKTQ
jgi:hypothetical protein